MGVICLNGECFHRPRYSLVCPAYNERANIAPLVREWEAVFQQLRQPFEIILVDDGSTDGTFEEIRQLCQGRPYLVGVRLRHRCGQSAALLAGFHRARGEWIITSDADLQNDPGDLPRLLVWCDSADLICGWRRDRQDPLWKRWVSRLANWRRRRLLNDQVHDTGCGLKVLRRELAMKLLPFDGMHRFIPALAQIEGYRVAEVPVNHRPRQRERSKYTFWNRLIKPVQDLRGVAWYRARRIRYEVAEEIRLPDQQQLLRKAC
jgi:dolichol-phosphate mannosyltransferase